MKTYYGLIETEKDIVLKGNISGRNLVYGNHNLKDLTDEAILRAKNYGKAYHIVKLIKTVKVDDVTITEYED